MTIELTEDSRLLLPRELYFGRLVMIGFLAIVLLREFTRLDELDNVDRFCALTGIASLSAGWVWFWAKLAASPESWRQGVAVVAVLAGAVILTLVSPAGVFPFYYAVIVAGAAFRWRIGVWLVAMVTVITVATWYAVDDTVSIQVGLIAALFGSAAVTVRRVVSAQVTLNRTQEDLHRLASVEARMDFARDLHDQLGQELTTTILQAEILRMDLQDADPEVRSRADQVVKGTRNSLRLMRESVTGARPPLLRTEEPLSRALLESVGITCTLEASIPVTQPSNQALLGWVLRESVTNVLRHSNATRCVIALSSETMSTGEVVTLQVSDDGGGNDTTAWGSGLSGMRERVAAVAGTLSVDVPTTGGWRVTVSIPEPS